MHALGTVADAGQIGIVEHDGDVVGRQLHVELDVAHAQGHGGCQCLQRILGKFDGIAAMRDDLRQPGVVAVHFFLPCGGCIPDAEFT